MRRGVQDYTRPGPAPLLGVSDVFQGTPFGEMLARRTPEDRKETGQRRVWDNAGEWRAEALQCVREWFLTLPDGEEVTADDWREVVPIEPPHFNAWGALAGVLAKNGWIEFAQKFKSSRQPQGNANTLRVWRVNRAAVELDKQGRAA